MELLILLIIALVVWLFIAPAVALGKIGSLNRRVEQLERKLAEKPESAVSAAKIPARAVETARFEPPPVTPVLVPEERPVAVTPPALPPPLPLPLVKDLPFMPPPSKPDTPVAPGVSFSLEQFVGVKLFAWIGGLALFFGIVFFVKYAFERDLIPPAVRVASGYATAAALMAAGYWFRQRQAYRVLTQTLSATGILAFYGVTYAAHAWYHFPVYTTAFTFVLMALITAGAFLTAVRAKAEVVAVLGLAGGFLTPALVSSGQDQPVILFTYITLLNLGLAALAWREKWWRLLPLGAVGTVLVSWGWRIQFFDSEGYELGGKTWGMVAVFGGFALLFAGLAVLSKRKQWDAEVEEPWWAALLAAVSALLLAFDFLKSSEIGGRPVLLYTLVLLASSGWLAAGWFFQRYAMATLYGSLAVMLHLAWWMNQWLTPELLPHALAINLIFGLIHLGFITQLIKRGLPVEGYVPGGIALIMMVVMGLPLVLLKEVSWMLWPPFLLAGLLTLVIATLNRKAWIGLLALTLAMAATLHWLNSLRHQDDALASFLMVLGMATLVFATGAAVLRKWMQQKEDADEDETVGFLWIVQQAALSAPYALLAAVPHLIRLEAGQTTLLLSATLLLSLVAVWLSRKMPWLTLSAWLGWTLVSLCVCPSAEGMMLWQTLVPALGLVLLWLMRKSYGAPVAPFAAVGVMMTGSLWILHERIWNEWPESLHGVLPAVFALGWIAMTRRLIADKAELAQRAWAGGLAIWFITLIFPFQFDYEWLTLAWALEAAGLCWLFTRLPHDGLRLTGFGLSVIAFVRLLLMGTVLDYDSIPLGLPMSLWLLISFGLSSAALMTAAYWLKPPHHEWREIPLRALLWIGGGVLLFLLVNLQIANAFMPVDAHQLTLQFGGNFARDMSYSIAWGLFSLVLLVIGFWKAATGARYAAVGLLLVTLAKLFLHDLEQVGSIYRIGAFLVVAMIALGASFLYQRAGKQSPEVAD
jgi:hypothetical protein